MIESLPRNVYRIDEDRRWTLYSCVFFLSFVPLIMIFQTTDGDSWLPTLIICALALSCFVAGHRHQIESATMR